MSLNEVNQVEYQEFLKSMPWLENNEQSLLIFQMFQQKVKDQVSTILESEKPTNQDNIKPRKKKLSDSSVKLLSANEFLWTNKNKSLVNELLYTFRAVWLFEFDSISDLKNLSHDDFSYKNHEDNYKTWLWRKLFLTDEEIAEKDIEDINNMSSKYLQNWSMHMQTYLSNFGDESQKKLKSTYFDSIHSMENINVFSLIKYSMSLEKEKRQEKKVLKTITDKINTESEKLQLLKYELQDVDEWTSYESKHFEIKNKSNQLRKLERQKIKAERSIDEKTKWQYEIQRLLWLSVLYMDREKNHIHQHTEEDNSYLMKLMQGIINQDDNILVNFDNKSTNPFYGLTDDRDMYYTREKWWTYDLKEADEIFPEDTKEHIPVRMSSLTIEWKARWYQKNKSSIDVLHAASRWEKGGYSSVNKLMLKKMKTFNEILDHKWFMFVVNDLQTEGEKLIKVIENELGTLRTSWMKWPETERVNNNNSDSSYKSLQWTIKVPYKGERLKQFYSDLSELLVNNWQIDKKLASIFANTSKAIESIDSTKDENIWLLKEIDQKLILEIQEVLWSINNKDLLSNFEKYKNRFKNKQYNIELEIQIFDKDSYIRSKVDDRCPAFHAHYKKKQMLKLLEELFPESIYNWWISEVIDSETSLFEEKMQVLKKIYAEEQRVA